MPSFGASSRIKRIGMPGVIAAVVVAAGRGLRAGGELPKQYRKISGVPMITRALSAFIGHPGIAMVQAVIHPADTAAYRAATQGLTLLQPVFGGDTRQASVRAGLEALEPYGPQIVLVHDAARPFASEALIAHAIAAAQERSAAVPVTPVTDTVKSVDARGVVTGTPDRATLCLVQTPQAFRFRTLIEAHRRAHIAGRDRFTDDAALAEWAGIEVTTFAGETGNVKLTSAEDFARADALSLAASADVRMGFGFDVHQFAPGDHVMLGGIRVPHERGLTGHSDADVVLHALVDAILGALAEGDIGMHFPPTDPRWHGASSERFLAFAVERVHSRAGQIAHLDVTVVCESPRIGPVRDAIRGRIADIAAIPKDRVAVKATTTEKMGFTGRGEGIAAFATATLRLPVVTG
jgi:2-C-methyl-D-erythritol 4-phosphate cytidylyltransferase/2-C-methyl-D-erythritol 2,4-cyclodiphosphate synthase